MDGDSDLWTAAAAFRGTEEYAAAFDLEVWKAQQQARLRTEMQEERARQQRAVAAEVRRAEERRLAELDELRAQLEQTARRLQLREEALQRRAAQFEARESTFEERRVRVAAEHEQHLAAVEARARRQLDEASASAAHTAAELRERDATAARLEQRLRAAESECEALRRAAQRAVADTSGAERIQRLEEELAAVGSHAERAQRELREREAELATALRERDELSRAARLYKEQLADLARRYGALQQQWHERERDALAAERQRLDAAQRRHDAEGNGPRREGVQSAQVRGHRFEVVGSRAAGSADECRALLAELRGDVAAGLRAATATAPQRVVYAEVPATRGAAQAKAKAKAKPKPATGESEAAAERERTLDVDVSSLSRHDEGRAMSAEPLADLSSSYGYAEIASWRSEDRALPPRPPFSPSAAQDYGPLSPNTPREVQGATAELEMPSASRKTAREEMIAFVTKLRENRQRLVESGVYDERDPLLHEMTEKIALYEQFLSEHYVDSSDA